MRPAMSIHTMATRQVFTTFLCALLCLLAPLIGIRPVVADDADATPTDITWPRVFEKDGKRLTVYQPQVDSWKDYQTLHIRCAIGVEGVLDTEHFGVVECDASTIVDHASRMVAISPTDRDVRFANVTEEQDAQLKAAVAELNPPSNVVIISLDRVLAYLDPTTQDEQPRVDLNLDPPKIYSSEDPAILVMFMGKPKLEPVVPDRPDIKFALNTNWTALYDGAAEKYFLLDGDGWISAADPLNGPWIPVAHVPFEADDLPDDANWADAREHIPGTPPETAPRVFVSEVPAELIVTDGPPEFASIPSTALSRVTNTDSVLFRDTTNSNYYFLVAGRWFSAESLDGPWAAASADLPPDFAQIPDSDPSAFVKACVPGTQEAQDAVLLASVPNTTVVNTDEKPVQVTYDGTPQFAPIQGSDDVQSAVNTSSAVFRVNDAYYCCDQGVWFDAPAATGPWAFCTSVPPAIYTIPPSSPQYNVTYVTVQASTPTTVTYAQTAGYSGEYVAATGVLMFGAGMLVGAAIANNNDNYYYHPPYPCYYSYGCGATYHYGYGGYYAGAAAYGPYAGVGHAAAYNPATGTYARGAAAYGPYGSTRAAAAYNPYTGARGAAQQVNTAYGSAGRAAGYNPTTGNYARGGYASGQYGSAGFAQAYNPRTGAYAGAGAVSTNNGQAAAWNTSRGQGAVAKTNSGDIYASNGNSVYKRDSDGSWSTNSGNGWNRTSNPQSQTNSTGRPNSAPAGSQSQRNLNAQAQARSRGSQMTQRTNQFQSRGGARGSNGSGRSGGGRSGGGRRR